PEVDHDSVGGEEEVSERRPRAFPEAVMARGPRPCDPVACVAVPRCTEAHSDRIAPTVVTADWESRARHHGELHAALAVVSDPGDDLSLPRPGLLPGCGRNGVLERLQRRCLDRDRCGLGLEPHRLLRERIDPIT